MKFTTLIQIFVSLGFFSELSLVDAQTTAKSLRVEMVPGGPTTGCCSALYYLATNQELFNFVNATTIATLQAQNVSTSNLIINNFFLIYTNQCLFRERSLLRGSEVAETEEVERHAVKARTNQYSSTCSACTRSSCSAYCSGCYLCSSDRRDLQLLGAVLGLVGGVVTGLLGVTLGLLNLVVGDLSQNIQPHFVDWFTNGEGANFANGCMGDPSLIQVTITLV